MKKLLLFFLPLFLFASTQKVCVQLEWKHQFEFAGFYAAKELGYYKDIGLDVELKEFKENIKISDDVIDGKVTFGVSSSALILEKLQNRPVVLLASYFKQNALVLVTSKDIKNISDLKNKKIMALPYEIDHTSLGVMLKDNNLNRDDYILIEHDFSVDKFINGEVDAMSIFLSNQPYILDKKNINYNILNPAHYGIYSYDLELFTSQSTAKKSPIMVKNFIDATNKGWKYAFEHKKEIVDLIYTKYSSKKSKEALLSEAYKTEKLFKTDIFKIGSTVPELIELNALVYKKLGLIKTDTNPRDILSSYIFQKEIISDNNLEESKAKKMEFTSLEQKYIKDKKQITMCIDPDWMPFESFKDGKYIGISADYFKIFENKIGITIKVQKVETWSESLELAKKRECDILSLIMQTPDRKKYLNFTTPYLSIPLVLATKPDVPFVSNIGGLKNKRIGIPKGYAFGEILKKRFPNLGIVDVKNTKDGLEKVNNGELFGYIGTLASVGYLFQREFTGELKIAGKFDENWELGIGVRNDDPTLLSIMQKVVDGIDDDTHMDILNKWIAINYEKGIDYTLVWQIILIAISILVGTLFWNTKLSLLNKQLILAKQKADDATKEKANFLANMSHEIRTPMNSITGMTYLIKETKLNEIQSNYIQKIEDSSKNLLKLLNDILDFSKLEARKLEIQKVDFNLVEILNTVENMLMVKSYEKGLELKTTYNKLDSINLYGDSLRLSQILINLLSNAIKFTHKGKVELTVQRVNSEKFRFSISDTGIGLTKEQIKDIFSSFTQADSSITRKYGGTGLGLAIAKELVELMNGKIWVESVFGEGSRFIFEVELENSTKEIAFKEIESKQEIRNMQNKKIPLTQEMAKELFLNLKEATKKRRPQLCESVLQEFEQYSLDEESQELFNSVNNLIRRYKFDDAIAKLLEERSHIH